MKKMVKDGNWGVFEASGSTDGAMQLQFFHEPEGGAPLLSGDDEVVRRIISRAKRGDVEALDALWAVIDEDGLVNRVLWCEALGLDPRRFSGYELWEGPERT